MLPTPPIHPLADAAGELASATGKLLACDDAIVFEDAVVVTPGNATLVHDLSLRVPLGTNLLVTGPNGAGKSSLFRWVVGRGLLCSSSAQQLPLVLHRCFCELLTANRRFGIRANCRPSHLHIHCLTQQLHYLPTHAAHPPSALLPATRVLGGLWPLARGRIYKPGGGADDAEGGLSHACFYVPQRPYVTQGTLQEQLVYPLSVAQERIQEAELRRLLAAVDLEYLLDRWGWGGVGVCGEGDVGW